METSSSKFSELRQKAVDYLSEKKDKISIGFQNDIEKLLEELNIHQIELEMQSDELSRTNSLLAKEHEKFLNLYLDAPIAYFTLNRNGNIHQLNKLAAELIGLPLHAFNHTSFFPFIDEQHKQAFTKLLKKAFQTDLLEYGEIVIINRMSHQLVVSIQAQAYYDQDKDQKFCRCAVTNITKQKQTEQDLKASHRKFESIFNNSPFHIWAFDGVTYHFVNQAYHDYTGLEKTEILGPETWTNFVHPDDFDEAVRVWLQAFETKSAHDNYFRLRGKDGNYRYFWSHAVPIFRENDDFEHFLAFNIDITERKVAEEGLKESEHNLKERLKELNGIYSLRLLSEKFENPEDIYLEFVNMVLPQSMRFSDEVFVKLIVNDQKYTNIENFEPSNQSEFLFAPIHLFGKQNGELVVRYTQDRPFIDYFEQKLINEYAERISIITEQIISKQEHKEAEALIKESEEKFKSYTQQSLIGIYTTDLDGDFTFGNDKWLEITGLTMEEAMGKGWIGALHPDDRDNIAENWYKSVQSDGAWSYEYRFVNKQGKITWIQGTAKALLNFKHEKIGFIGFNIDINLRKQAELRIQQQNYELKKLNADKDRFITIIAHDLKSPFNSILGFLNLLSKNIHTYDIEKIENQVNIINNSAKNTYQLLEEILIWASAQAGKIPFMPQNLVFSKICKDVFENLKLNASNKNITINCSIDPERTVFADKNMITTIMRNLVSNAIKFTEQGGHIEVSAIINNGKITITIADNGVGIEQTIITKLFDISEKITSLGTANERGSGLGLLLCKEFVDKHGGEIWVESELGKGSHFNFSLPLVNK